MVVLRIWKRCFQKWETNGAPQSEMMSSGNPWRPTTFANTRFVVSKHEMALEHGIKCTILVNRSTTTKMESCSSDGSKSVMKSIDMDDHSRSESGRGRSSPYVW